jgi:NAD(P)-dependent dehydrogenase (short-subunit alcohol dehydrogenase family)
VTPTHRDIVVITGASAGIGRAVAQEFARHGARLALLARSEERLAAACAEVKALGGTALAITIDVADANQVDAAADRIERELGPIDIWINSAMATIFAPLHKLGADELRRATEVTYLGTAYGTLSALRRMRPRGRGTIVQVGSALAYRAIPLQGPYCASKFAIRGLTDALRSELIHDGIDIHLTMVQLSAHNTPQFDWGRNRMPKRAQPVPPIFQPEVAARGIHYAAYARRREVWVGWPAVKIILGNKLLPWFVDRKLAKDAWDGQMDDAPADPHRPDNLFDSPHGSQGAHGRFDDRAKDSSLQLWMTMHRGVVLLTAAVLLLITVVLVLLLNW